MARLTDRHVDLLCKIFAPNASEDEVRSKPGDYLLELLLELEKPNLKSTAQYAIARIFKVSAAARMEDAKKKARIRECVKQIVWMSDGFSNQRG